MENNNSAIATVAENEVPISPFTSIKTFETAQRMANILCSSSLVPVQYQGSKNLPNCVIALEMANRVGVSPFLIMQNMHVIQGRPSMSAQYLIAMINASGKFSPLRWKVEKRGKKKINNFEIEDCTYVAWARELSTGEVLEGPEVTTEMAVREGWYGKNGSKWQTMPDLMFRYRSAAFFSRMYCPEMAMGLHTTEEIEEMPPTPEMKKVDAVSRAEELTKKLVGETVSSKDDFPPVVDVTPKAMEEKRPKQTRPVEAEPVSEVKEAVPDIPQEPAVPEATVRGQQSMDFGSPSDDAFEIPGVSVGDEEPF